MSQQATATGSYDDGQTASLGSAATWFIPNDGVATVDANGLVSYTTGGKVYGGVTSISASQGATITGSALIRVVATDSGSQNPSPYCPASNQQWLDLGLSPWGRFTLCQEVTGSLVMSGSTGGTLAVLSTTSPIYGQAEASWTRKELVMFDGKTIKWTDTANIPDPVAGAVGYLVYFKLDTAAGAGRNICGQSAANGAVGGRLFIQCGSANGKIAVVASGSTTLGTVDYRDGRVHPMMLVYTSASYGTANRAKLYTDLEVITGSFSEVIVAPTLYGIGSINSSFVSPSGGLVYFAVATGSIVDRLSNDGPASDTLKRLGWTVAF